MEQILVRFPDTLAECRTLLGNGNGTFRPKTDYLVGGSLGSVVVADVSRDGSPDLVVASAGSGIASGKISVLLGNDNGTFQEAVDHLNGGIAVPSFAVSDVNGDGAPDLLVASRGFFGGTPSVMFGNGDGTFQFTSSYSAGLSSLSLVMADLNGDSIPDLVFANYLSDTVTVLLSNGGGEFQARVDYGVVFVGQSMSVAVADVSGDRTPDLLVVGANFDLTGGVSVLLGNGDGTFQARVTYPTGEGPQSVAEADVSGDGKPDLVVANSFDNTASVLLGSGDGTFQAKVDYPTGSQPRAIVATDVSGDGKPDLVVSNVGQGTVSVLLGNGDGTFQAKADYSTGAAPQSVVVAEASHDGKPDLVVVNANDNTVSVLLGNGNGTFHARVDYPTGLGPVSVAVVDVNSDGQLDLVVPNHGADTVSVMLGNGNGTFQAKVDYPTGLGPVRSRRGCER